MLNMENKFKVKSAALTDLPQILAVYERARRFMKANGNESQWGLPSPGKSVWPSEEALVQRINEGTLFLCVTDACSAEQDAVFEKGTCLPTEACGAEQDAVCVTDTAGEKIAAVFGYAIGEDPVYRTIFDGSWPEGSEHYGTIHMIASSNIVHGAASYCFDWALKQCNVLRIDTHPNNKPMRSLLEKCGFTYCGKIIFEDVQNEDKLRVAFCKMINI